MTSHRPHLGGLEILVLMVVLRLDGNAYGQSVKDTLAERAGRNVSVGAVQTTLNRLEEKGMVISSRSEPEPRRGGRSKRLFRVTDAGVEALREILRAHEAMREGAE